MLRKALAILLVGFWLVLSAIDTLEDLDFTNYLKIHATETPDFAGFGRAANSANNIVENGTRHIGTGGAGLMAPSPRGNVGFQPHDEEAKTPKKSLKIYKLDSAFLI